MEFETKILSKGIQEMLYNSDKTVGTAESCTGGRIAEALISLPGASNYFKGGVVSYTNEVKENLLGVSHEVLEEQTAVCEEVAREMVLGTIKTLNVDFAISATGVAGPTGGTPAIPVGTIYVGYGDKNDVRVVKLTEDFGRDINLAIATNTALKGMLEFLKEHAEELKKDHRSIRSIRRPFPCNDGSPNVMPAKAKSLLQLKFQYQSVSYVIVLSSLTFR